MFQKASSVIGRPYLQANLFVTAVLFIVTQPAAAQFAGGSGTEEDPYQIETVEQLQNMNEDLDAHYVQIDDIDASATEEWNGGNGFRPIGSDIIPFSGSFNGQYYKIDSLVIDLQSDNDVGLFGVTSENSTVKSVILESSSITAEGNAGGLVGENKGVVKTSVSRANINSREWSGILVGMNEGTIINSRSKGSITGKWDLGGLSGGNFGKIVNSSSQSIVKGENRIGGLVGQNGGEIRRSSALTRVIGERNMGGLVGWCTSTITTSYSKGAVTAKSGDMSSVGGLTGTGCPKIVKSFHSHGKVVGSKKVGGLVGRNSGSATIRASYAVSKVEGGERVGGFSGTNEDTEDNTPQVTESFSAGTVTGNVDTGGFIGATTGEIDTSYWDIDATGKSNGVGLGSSEGVTGLSTEQMTGSDAKENMKGFDFEDTWRVRKDDYPALDWEPALQQTLLVNSEGRKDFERTGVALRFFGVADSGKVDVQKFEDALSDTSGIGEENVSSYRFVINAQSSLDFDSTEVRFNLGSLAGIGNPESVIIYRRPIEGAGTFIKLPTTYDSAENELVGETDDFSEFAMASNTEPLPVEIARIEATRSESDVVLSWKTTSERDNAGFGVQHKTDEQTDWEQLDFVESKAEGGTASGTKSYQYLAEDLPVGTHQFRLKQVDLDGGASFSRSVTAVVPLQEALKLTAPAPNPVSGSGTLSFAIKKETEAIVSLYNVLGQRVETLYEGTPPPGESQQFQIDASNLSSGLYILRLQADGKTQTRRLTVVR